MSPTTSPSAAWPPQRVTALRKWSKITQTPPETTDDIVGHPSWPAKCNTKAEERHAPLRAATSGARRSTSHATHRSPTRRVESSLDASVPPRIISFGGRLREGHHFCVAPLLACLNWLPMLTLESPSSTERRGTIIAGRNSQGRIIFKFFEAPCYKPRWTCRESRPRHDNNHQVFQKHPCNPATGSHSRRSRRDVADVLHFPSRPQPSVSATRPPSATTSAASPKPPSATSPWLAMVLFFLRGAHHVHRAAAGCSYASPAG